MCRENTLNSGLQILLPDNSTHCCLLCLEVTMKAGNQVSHQRNRGWTFVRKDIIICHLPQNISRGQNLPPLQATVFPFLTKFNPKNAAEEQLLGIRDHSDRALSPVQSPPPPTGQ
jgi:hypothetical protein